MNEPLYHGIDHPLPNTEGDIVEHINLKTDHLRLEKQQKHPLDPTTYDSQTITNADLATHMRTEQYLSDTTIQKTQRYLHFIETHKGYPVDLRNNPSEIEIIRHIRYRLYYENPPATIDACRHELLALNRYLRAIGRPPVHYKLPPKPKHQHTLIPLPDTVKEFWHYQYDKRRPIRKLYQYMMYHGFLIGMRAPSEIANLRDYDIHFNHDGTATITITETKKHGSKRTLLLPVELATDPRFKSLRNWFNSWRPRIAKENCDALFPTIKGNDWNTNYLGNRLSYNGKKVWPYYHPYTMRHWSATARMIQTKIQTGAWDTYSVQCWHGHETIGSTEKYIRTAMQYIQTAPYDWIHRSLTKTNGFEERPTDQRPTDRPVPVTEGTKSWARREPFKIHDVFPIISPPFFFLCNQLGRVHESNSPFQFAFFIKQLHVPFIPPHDVGTQVKDQVFSPLLPYPLKYWCLGFLPLIFYCNPYAEHPLFLRVSYTSMVCAISGSNNGKIGYRHRVYASSGCSIINYFCYNSSSIPSHCASFDDVASGGPPYHVLGVAC